MIDVIIPAYNAHDTIDKTLFSIAFQDIVDNVNVYIVNDCSNKDYSDIVEFFSHSMNICEIKLDKNEGPGLARQKGIESSKGKYIMFIDADDNLSDCLAIKKLYDCINNSDYDVVISNFVEEQDNRFIDHMNDSIWLHGKIYRRSFIENNNICFNSTRANEDNGFNQFVRFMGGKSYYLNTKTYIWRNNSNSITRKNNKEFNLAGLKGYSYNVLWAMKKAIENGGNLNLVIEMAFLMQVSAYYYYLKYQNLDLLHDFLVNVKEICEILDKYKIEESKKIELFKSQWEYSLNNNFDGEIDMIIPIITFKEFLDIVKSIDGECNI